MFFFPFVWKISLQGMFDKPPYFSILFPNSDVNISFSELLVMPKYVTTPLMFVPAYVDM